MASSPLPSSLNARQPLTYVEAVTPQLVERSAQLAALRSLLHDCTLGGRLVLLSGEAGAGKSALVQSLLEEQTTTRSLVGRCDDLFAARPLGPIADMARTSVGPLRNAIGSDNLTDTFDAMLGELAAPPCPVIVVFEDVHWADEATLDLIRFVARRLEALRCLMIVTHRIELASDHPLRRTAGALVGPCVSRLTVPPLSLDAVRTLAAGSNVDPVELHARTGGNAFFVSELLAEGSPGIPPTVRDAILGRAALLGRAARNALDAAAVLGRSAEVDIICRVAECGPEAIDECVGAGLLEGNHRVQAFRHDLSRDSIELALAPLRRRALHARALDALMDQGDIVQLAHHAIGAGDAERIVDLSGRAAKRCVDLGAYREAARLFGSALSHIPANSPDRTQLLEGRAFTCERTEQFDGAIAAGEELVAGSTDEQIKGRWEAWLGGVCRCAGRREDAWALLASSVARLEPLGESVDLARALGLLAQHQMVSSRNAAAILTARRALPIAERFDAEDVVVHLLDTLGAALACAGDDGGIALLVEAVDRARKCGIHHELTRSSENLGEALLARHHAIDALAYLDEGIEVATNFELRFSRNALVNVRGAALLLVGRWDDAVASAHAVLAEPDVAASNRCLALKLLGTIRARRGDPEWAAALDEAWLLALPYGEPQLQLPLRLARAEAASLTGDHAALEREMRQTVASTDGGDVWFAGAIAVWCRRAGIDWEPQTKLADQFVLMLAGDFRGAATIWDALGCSYEAADALGQSSDEADLREALVRLNEFNARPRALQVTRSLRAMGVREIPRGPRAATRANAAGLTAREQEIAALLAAGFANTEIAARLVLSPKTVDHHVSSVLSKLAVTTRRHVARAADALGLDLKVEGAVGAI